MYILIAGGGKVGANLTKSVLDLGHEVTLIEQRRDRFERLEEEFEHRVQLGDATDLFVLERAGIARPPDLVVAVTGDDEDNIVICQMAREHYGVEKMIEREVPEHGLIHLLELRKENLEIVEVQLGADSPSVGKRVSRIQLPAGSRLITVMRDGHAQMAEGETELRAGDQVLAVLEPGKEEELRRVLLRKGG